ncbi:DUF1850 domain-containing protein [Neobacillus dielmonensis]|uniref:DUF1850 domain-containing protein n=1 Tax=Neobacillus dielmonensis TaxID=1347369 RepID=UPI0005AA6864|nr:DUF1850 domain-containing protein [Neobacillus dielmonensis]
MKKTRIRLITLIIIILMAILIFFPYRQAVVFQPRDHSMVFAYFPINDDQTFKIKYTHSIHLSDVVESYKILPNKEIQQYELMYAETAVGMPANAAEGEKFEHKNGKYYIKNMKRTFPYFYLRIGQVRANHRVIFQNKQYQLSKSIKPGTSVKVAIRNLNLLQQWKGVNILESF